MLRATPVTILSFDVEPLSVPLEEPFVIATGALTETRSVLVRVALGVGLGDGARKATGLGEAAALPPVTSCDQVDLLEGARIARPSLEGAALTTPSDLPERLASMIAEPVLRAGVEAAILDAWARLEGCPVFQLLEPASRPVPMATDITIPIGAPAHMAALAGRHHARGFSVFKIKVGRDVADDVTALRAIVARVPSARLRVDANGGYDPSTARAFLKRVADLPIECFEQPCARGQEDAMAALARETAVPIVADESLRSRVDLARIIESRCAAGVNLKLAKLGSLVEACAVGRLAIDAGLSLMVGAMVETRLGLTAMLHVATALGGARFVDLDTQLLLAREAFTGGYRESGAEMIATGGPGFDLLEAEP